MQADFQDAHQRHWEDAERLLLVGRLANADHLYGVSAECGLKKLMLAFGMPYDAAKDMPGLLSDRAHANKIWMRYETYRAGHVQGVGYILPANNPFHDWDVSDRYANQSNFSLARVQGHQAGSQVIRALIKKAQLEGMI